jgi:hypothetical protein
MSLAAQPGRSGWLPALFGLGDSGRYDVVYGVLDHRGPALAAPFQEGGD